MAIKVSCADEFINELDGGALSELGEKGAGLSEGQMQRIAIARAVYADHPIIIFDEATSSLDEETEGRLLKNLKELTSKTVIIITHRKAAISICDRVLEFDEDGVKERKII